MKKIHSVIHSDLALPQGHEETLRFGQLVRAWCS